MARGLTFKASPTIADFMRSKAYVRGVMGPIGSGKSAGCSVELGQWAGQMPPCPDGVRRSKFAIVRNTYKQLEKTTLATWLQWFKEKEVGPFNYSRMVHKIAMKGFEAEFHFQALDRPQDIDNLLSLELTGAWINEAREIPFEVIQMVEGRTARFPRKEDVPVYRSGLIMDTNPPDTDHWWYVLAEELAPTIVGITAAGIRSYRDALHELSEFLHERKLGHIPGLEQLSEEKAANVWRVFAGKYKFFRQPGAFSEQAENLEHLDPDYYIRQMIGKSQEWINVYVNGNYGIVMDGKPVFPEYNDSFHFNERLVRPVKNLKVMRGWDFGRTPACVFSQVDQWGRWLVFDELCGRDMSIHEFGPIVQKHCAVEYPGVKFVDYCDPSGFFKGDKDDQTCAAILAGMGIHVEGGVQNPRIRIESVSKALRGGLIDGKPEFQIGPKAAMTRKGLMGGYSYRRMQVSGERYTDEPQKNEYSHPVDALQYVGTMLYKAELFDPRRDDGEEDEEFLEATGTDTGRSSWTGY